MGQPQDFNFDKKIDSQQKALQTSKRQQTTHLNACFYGAVTAFGLIAGDAIWEGFVHDPAPYEEARAAHEQGDLYVPPAFYAENQEKCIRYHVADRAAEFSSVNLDGLSSKALMADKDNYIARLNTCDDQSYQLFEAPYYVESLKHNNWAETFGSAMAGGVLINLLYAGFWRRREQDLGRALKANEAFKQLFSGYNKP